MGYPHPAVKSGIPHPAVRKEGYPHPAVRKGGGPPSKLGRRGPPSKLGRRDPTIYWKRCTFTTKLGCTFTTFSAEVDKTPKK